MNQNKAQELRAGTLSSLKLPSSDITEDLVNSFRSFLDKTNSTKDVVGKHKPSKRKTIVRKFLSSKWSSSATVQQYFWPAEDNQIPEAEIVQQLSDFMLLDLNRIPRHPVKAGQPSKPPIHSEKVVPQSSSQRSLQQDSQDIELAAAAAARIMDKLDQQDPTYAEETSDFVLDTSRQTRQLSKTSSASPQAQLQSPVGFAKEAPTTAGLPPARSAHVHNPSTPNTSKHNHAFSPNESNSGQLQTPPPSDKRLGKRPAAATDPYDIADDELFFFATVPDRDVSPKHSPPTAQTRKRARFDETFEDLETIETIEPAAATIGRSPFTEKVTQQARQATGQFTDISRTLRPSSAAPVLISTTEVSPNAAFSPSRSRFESFYASTPPSTTADIAVQCEMVEAETRIDDRIVVDFQGLNDAQLFDLPLVFLDHLGECRRSHEMIGTNESRVRAAVLRDIEDDLRMRLKGPRYLQQIRPREEEGLYISDA